VLDKLPRAYAYKIAPEMNAGKRAALQALQSEWRRTLPLAFEWFWRPFLAGGLFPYKPARSGPRSTFPATALVTSQKDLMALAIEGQARSWGSNLARRISRSVIQDQVLAGDATLRRQLLWINSMRAWLLPYRQQVDLLQAQPAKQDRLEVLTPDASRIMRKLVRRYIELHRLPDPMQLPLQVNQLSATWSSAQKTRSSWAHRWLRISTLTRGRKVSLPVMRHEYADRREGRQALTFSLVPRGDDWYVISTKYVQPTTWSNHGVDVLAIDLGLRNLMSTSEGDVRGAGFLDKLQRYDAQLLRLQQGLQAAGIRRLAECRRYRLFVQRLRGFLKTQMQTHLKALLERHRPKKVVIEDLLFAGQQGELSRRMNRLLRRFGQRYFVQTLEERKDEFGFELVYVEPAYTSQTCACCGFVHPDNRKGDRFKCLSCGHLGHADVNAAKNLARRSGQEARPLPGGRHAWRVRSLHQWAARLRATMQKETSGSPRFVRAAGSARAGLSALAKKQTSAKRLTSEDLITLTGLLNGYPQEPSELGSTRKSG